MHRVWMLTAVSAIAGVANGQVPESLAGCWAGSVAEGAAQRRMVLELVHDAAGWRGIVDVLSRTSEPDSLSDIAVQSDSLTFTIPGDTARVFRGAHASGVIIGQATAAGRTLPFRLERSAGTHPARTLLGYWSGRLEQGGNPLMRLAIQIREAPCGDVLVTMDSPDQGAENLPVTSVAVRGDSLLFEMTYLNGSYAGKLSGDVTSIAGTWVQNGVAFDLDLARGDSARLRRPQEPEPPYPYDEEDITFESPDSVITLAGTLTLPEGQGPFPAAVLLSGSGAQNRDEALMGHRPFLVIADYLTRRGIAVLRYDDRGVGGSGGNTIQSTISDNAGDALAAVATLRRHARIDADRIGLIGHSEGGWVAPVAASRSDDVAFIVLLAGPGVTGEELLHAQTAAIFRAEGASEDVIDAYKAYAALLYDVVRMGTDIETAVADLERRRATLLDSLPRRLAAALDSIDALTPAAQDRAQFGTLLTPWFRYLLDFDPRPHLRRVRVPILALIGEKDLQVPPDQSIPMLRAICTESGHRDCTVRELAGLNHLFQTAGTGRIAEYGVTEETFAPPALETIGDWIVERVGK